MVADVCSGASDQADAEQEVAILGRRRRHSGGYHGPPSTDVFDGLRRQVIDLDPAESGLSPSSTLPHVWGLLMDIASPTGVATLVALADGTTSLYTSTGGGIIGGGEHPQVAAASRRLLEVVERHLPEMPASTDTTLPTAGRVALRALTSQDCRGVDTAEDDLGYGRHALSPVFHAAHEVITQLRLVDERRPK
jgi:hypothetical protein